MYKRYIKRMIDILLSIIGIVLCAPFMLLIALWIKLDSKGPVFFTQRRIGKGKKLFTILKFRTMCQDAPHDVPTHQLQKAGQYITRPGRILRRASLDELPQLINIFLGQMSFIGPRPALWNQFDLIELRDEYGANDVLPGMGGWAQVNGRDELALSTKALRDGEYAQNISFALDVKCFLLTIVKVLRSDGIVEGRGGGKYTAKRMEAEE